MGWAQMILTVTGMLLGERNGEARWLKQAWCLLTNIVTPGTLMETDFLVEDPASVFAIPISLASAQTLPALASQRTFMTKHGLKVYQIGTKHHLHHVQKWCFPHWKINAFRWYGIHLCFFLSWTMLMINTSVLFLEVSVGKYISVNVINDILYTVLSINDWNDLAEHQILEVWVSKLTWCSVQQRVSPTLFTTQEQRAEYLARHAEYVENCTLSVSRIARSSCAHRVDEWHDERHDDCFTPKNFTFSITFFVIKHKKQISNKKNFLERTSILTQKRYSLKHQIFSNLKWFQTCHIFS